MNQRQRREYLLRALLQEDPAYRDMGVPEAARDQKQLLRGLLNVRIPKPVDREFLKVQDQYLQEATARKGITDLRDLTPIQEGLYLWRGDITTLRCDAIVNAANSQMLGCFCPCHGCIDNAIHTYAGVQLRLRCQELMEAQGHPEETGGAKLTPAYNLPCKFVLHTVGPIITGRVTARDEALLASCYRACLTQAAEAGLHSVAFCCISTGEFHFPNQRAAEIAVDTVTAFQGASDQKIEVIFNVFKETDQQIYRQLLGQPS
jgi:O-acetyl-ADP-ribose deacetylase (regulator of RNase III)